MNAKYAKSILPLFLAWAYVNALPNFTFSVQKALTTKQERYVYALGLMKQSKLPDLYWELGAVAIPNWEEEQTKNIKRYDDEEIYTHSLYGLYAGSYLSVIPLIRPGLLFGIVFQKKETHRIVENVDYVHEYSIYKPAAYLGASVHFGILNFTVSNHGAGAGLSFRFWE